MMKSRLVLYLFVVAALLLGAQSLFAQAEFRVELIVQDNGAGIDTVTFGANAAATYCIDAALGEFELPPKPPNGVFDARFTDQRGTGDCLGQGVSIHLQPYVTATDTFQIDFQPGDGGFPFHLSWPAGLTTYFDVLKLVDLFGGILVNVDMLTNSVATVPAPFGQLRIIGHVVVGVKKESNLIPNSFELNQNYPNPFNPTTTVKFAIEKTAQTDVAVFDVLGRKVTTLVAEQLTPGFYSAKWNGTDDLGMTVGSGVYYVRMSARAENNDVFSAVRKIMLMK